MYSSCLPKLILLVPRIDISSIEWRKIVGAQFGWVHAVFPSGAYQSATVLQRNSANHSGAYTDACHNERLATFCFGPVGRKYRPFWIFNFQRSSKPLRRYLPPPPLPPPPAGPSIAKCAARGALSKPSPLLDSRFFPHFEKSSTLDKARTPPLYLC